MKTITSFSLCGLLLALSGCAQQAEADQPPAQGVTQVEAPALRERMREVDPTRQEAVELQGGITQRQALPPNDQVVPPNQDELPPNPHDETAPQNETRTNEPAVDRDGVPLPENGNTYRTGRAHFLPNDR